MQQPDVFILKSLIEAESEFVSGSKLAEALGISRVGVWARLEKLREEGFEVEAVRHRGYRLMGEPDALNENLVRAYMAVIGCTLDLVFCDEVDSTNTEAERHLALRRDTPFAVIAQRQSHGRGRLGRVWHSPQEGNLYASIAFRPNLAPAQMQTITLWLGVKVCHHVATRLKVPLKVKWPNDLVSDGRKVAGMLTEARVDSDRLRDLVFGLGMNINGNCDNWPANVSAVATSLAQLKGSALPINRVAAELLCAVAQAYDAYVAGEHVAEFADLWHRYDALRGKTVRASRGNTPISGTADGIDANGNMRLLQPDGTVQLVHAGEVSIGTNPQTLGRAK